MRLTRPLHGEKTVKQPLVAKPHPPVVQAGAETTSPTATTSATDIGKAATVVGGKYGARTGSTSQGAIPTMNGGNGSMLRHKLLEEMRPGDVLALKLEPTFLDGLFNVDQHAVAEAALRRARREAGIEPLPEGMHDEAYDGAFVKDGRAWQSAEIGGATIFVGGMNSNFDKTLSALAGLSAVTGEEHIGIHNSTSGAGADYFEIAGDLMKVGASRAAQTLASTIVSELVAHDGPVRLAGHSQGTLIISRAIELARDELVELGMPDAQQLLGRLEVRTFAGTAFDYPDGPRYQHFRNDVDPCPATSRVSSSTSAPAILKGLGALVHGHLPAAPKLGKGAVLVEFHDDAAGTPHSKHKLTTYLAHVVPFPSSRS